MRRKLMTGDSIAFIKRVNLIKFCIGICIRTNICPKTVFGFNAYQMIFPTLDLVGSGCYLLGDNDRYLFYHTRLILTLKLFHP